MKISQTRKAECRERLLEILKPGDTVYCTLRHVSRSGMFRVIDLHVIKDNEPRWIGRYAADLLERAFDDRKQGIRTSGCGMDMGFHLVSNLSYRLWPEGFGCIGERCPSNDHSNGDRDYTPHENAPERECATCKGTGNRAIGYIHSPHVRKEPCGWCGKTGQRPAGHMHRDGGYALRHRWM